MKQVNIIDQNNEGEGIARIDNIVTFIPYGLKDDIVDIEIIKEEKRYNIGKIVNIVTESKERTKPICKYYYECGGCNLMHQSYNYQLEFKKRNVINNIKKIANIELNNIDIITDNDINYRNHIRLHLNKKEIGFYSNKTNNIIDIEECLIANENINKIIKELRFFINAYKNHNIEEIDIKCYEGSMINIKSNGFIYLKELIKYVDVDSIYLNNEFEYGERNINARIGDHKFLVSNKSFLQKNSNITKKMYDYIKSLIDSNKNVLDLYCGVGTISIYIADICNKVYGIEIIKEAINNANSNIKLNNINNVEFECMDVDDISDIPCDMDIVIVDPPRTGLNKKALDNIININSSKIIYVSCNSTTLARDLNILKEKYEVISIKLFDMFPNTNHVESVVLLEKKVNNMKIGFTIGKFAPFHKGHEYLIEMAMKDMDEFYVVIYDTNDYPIELKEKWIRNRFKNIHILKAFNSPKEYGLDKNSINIQMKYLSNILKNIPVTHFYSSEEYGYYVSKYLNITNILIDKDRNKYNISSSKIKSDLNKYKEYLNSDVYSDINNMH